MNCVADAVQAVKTGLKACCKFLSANDTGLTGAHQSGIYITKQASSILFDSPCRRGENRDRRIRISWHDGTCTDSRAIYYGQGTRNEYRITGFGRGFPYLRPEHTGSLFVLVWCCSDYYRAFVFDLEDEINEFLDAVGITSTQTDGLIGELRHSTVPDESEVFFRYIDSLDVDFPDSVEMSRAAREFYHALYGADLDVRLNPDRRLVDWTDIEFRLFRAFEFVRYRDILKGGFRRVDEFVETALQVLNRRKSRAGKSLEHHLAALFTGNGLRFDEQAVTEGNKRPDFLFPSAEAYHSPAFATDGLVTLAAKTTCKDRWRQVINEADRLRDRPKYLCTLQRGISPAQLLEMESEKVVLVVPKMYHTDYPPEWRDAILSVGQFIAMVREMEGV